MRRAKRFFILLLALMLLVNTVLPAYAADTNSSNSPASGTNAGGDVSLMSNSGESGSNTGSGAGGGATAPGSGTVQWSTVGVTLQVVTYPYGDTFNRNNSYNNITDTIQNYSTANEGVTVYDGISTTDNTFMLDPHTGRVYKAPGFNKDTQTGSLVGSYGSDAIAIHPVEQNCVTVEMDGGLSHTSSSVTMPAMNKVEQFLQRIILGNEFGSWDIHDVAKDSSGNSLENDSTATSADDVSLFAQVLRYLGCGEELINNYVKGYSGQLDANADYNTRIPTIIWSYVTFESYTMSDLGRTPSPSGFYYHDSGSLADNFYFTANSSAFYYPYTCYTVGDIGVYTKGQSGFDTWWKTAYASSTATQSGFGSCNWGGTQGNSFVCKSALGTHNHTAYMSAPKYSSYMLGSGFVNSINANGVDASTDKQFYFRGYWTPYGDREEVPKRSFTLTKSIDASDECIAQIQGNPMYSLAGAEYQVSVNGTVIETLITDADGKANSSKEYEIGTVISVTETKAPKGFKLNAVPYTFTIGDSNNFGVKDKPLFDPPFAITKVDKDTTNPQGNSAFSGAIFKWEYFANTNWSGNATRTWFFETDRDGYVFYEDSYLASGYTSDDLYFASAGDYQIPLGSVKITELQNPLGYIVMPQPLFCSIVADSSTPSGTNVIWSDESLQFISDMATGNFGIYEPIDESLFGSLTIDKVDSVTGKTPQGAGSLEGAKFQVINNSTNSVKIGDFPEAEPGEVCYEFYTDANGHYETGSIFPLGSYTVKEAVPPTGYTLNSEWSQSFTVESGNLDFAFTVENGKACPDTPILGGIQIIKNDSVLGDKTGSDALLNGITFSVISENKQPVIVNGTEYQKGDTVLTLEVKWNGSQWTASTGDSVLPYGTYTVKENAENAESSHANPYYQLNTDPQTVQIQDDKAVVKLTFTNTLLSGKIHINKETNTGENKGNWKFDLYDSNKNHLGTYTTSDDGSLTISDLVPGTYYLTEQGSSDPYWVCDTEEKEVTVEPGKEISVTFTNTHYGKLLIRKEMTTDGPLGGWQFKVTRLSDNSDMGTLITGEDGTILSDNLLPGDYLIEEIFEENSLYYCKGENPVTISVKEGETTEITFTNALRPGKIEIEKVNLTGDHLPGAKFLLEWSEDGETWTPVVFSDKEDVVKGGCGTDGLTDGWLITDDTGTIVFENLYPGIQYRVTELEAPEGYVKLADYAFVGKLPVDELEVTLKVVNGQGFVLPVTGVSDFGLPTAFGVLLAFLALITASILGFAYFRPAMNKKNNMKGNETTMKKSKFTRFFSLLLVLCIVASVMTTPAFAAEVPDATVQMDEKCELTIFNYDWTNAAKDGIWNQDSYVSTGQYDSNINELLGGTNRKGDSDAESVLGNSEKSNGYAIKGVEFTYLQVADLYQYEESGHIEVLYKFDKTLAADLLAAIGLDEGKDSYAAANSLDASSWYYQSDVLNKALAKSLVNNATGVKNALESYVKNNGGTAMPLTDENGCSAVEELSVGLYLLVETKVPEQVNTTNPFFVSLPMTNVNGGGLGTSVTDGGHTWLYDVTVYPKNETGIVTLEKTVREAGNGEFKHHATASAGDTVEYQIVSTLPTITSKATNIAEYTYQDVLARGLTYSDEVVKIEWFKDAACTEENKVATWTQGDGKFVVSQDENDDKSHTMTISMTPDGLAEINADNGTLYAGYSNHTMRITYSAILNSDESVVYGDAGNCNEVVLTWRRSSQEYFDTLIDDCHIFTYGINLSKEWSDKTPAEAEAADMYKHVRFVVQNKTDNKFIVAELNEEEGVWYVTGHTDSDGVATEMYPVNWNNLNGQLVIKGLEDDEYILTEVETANRYVLLKEDISVVISTAENKDDPCGVYTKDTLGVIQNDPRFNFDGDMDLTLANIPQEAMAHNLLKASAKVDGNDVTMINDEKDADSTNALVPLTVVNTQGFDLPQSGETGISLMPIIGALIIGVSVLALCFVLFYRRRDKNQ